MQQVDLLKALEYVPFTVALTAPFKSLSLIILPKFYFYDNGHKRSLIVYNKESKQICRAITSLNLF
jgi:hypothetical protein